MKKCVAEFIGTFALVFAGTGAIIINEASGGAITQVGIALTFGLVVLAMAKGCRSPRMLLHIDSGRMELRHAAESVALQRNPN
jgi:major intrinsic protein